MQALAFASDFPDRAERVLVLASAARQSAVLSSTDGKPRKRLPPYGTM